MPNPTAVNIKNALIATPLTDFGRKHMRDVIKNSAMTSVEFLEKHYINPICNDEDWKLAIGGRSNNQDPDDNGKNAPQDPYLARFRDAVGTSKMFFENSFLGNESNNFEGLTQTVYIIEAVAGSGKTTYAEWLLHQKNGNIIVDRVDFEIAIERSTYFLSEIFSFPITTPVNSFKLALIKYIGRCISEPYERKNYSKVSKKIKTKVTKIVEIYNEYFCQRDNGKPDDEFMGFFDSLSVALSKKNFAEEIFNHLSSIIYPKTIDDFKVIETLVGILMRLYFCLAKSGLSNGKKYILFVDNIEWALMDEDIRNEHKTEGFRKPISDDDLCLILNAVFEASNRVETKITRFFKSSMDQYKTSFAILLAMREGTADILRKSETFKKQHNHELQPYWVNISNWYSFKSIIKDKIRTFLGDDDSASGLFIKAYDIAMSDNSTSKWALRRIIANAYNQNFRKLADNTSMAMSYAVESTMFFIEKWNDTVNMSEKDACYDALKHLCRKVFLRIILEYIQRTDSADESRYFTGICEYFPDKTDSCVRRVLNYLNNFAEDNPRQVFVPMHKLVKEVLHQPKQYLPKTNVTSGSLKSLALLLGHLNLAGSLQTNWTNLISIDFSESNMTLNKIINRDWGEFMKSRGKIGPKPGARVKITEAGKFFTMVIQDFEYFSSKYHPESKPLLMIDNNSDLSRLLFEEHTDREGNSIPGLITQISHYIKSTVSMEAGNTGFLVEPITRSLYKPKWLYRPSIEPRSKVHPRRIIDVHIGYLEDYLILLKAGRIGAENERSKMTNTIEATIKKYEKMKEDLQKNHKEYYELGWS
jgi:hypothetical protein